MNKARVKFSRHMESCKPRRLSFGTSKVSFPMEKYMREEQQISIPGSNSVDSNQYNNIEMKYACLQPELTSLESQYLALLQKQRFLNALREDKWSTEEDIENMNRDIRSLKKDREEQERANKEVLQTISDGIHQIIENQQTSKVLRVAAQTELQDVKRQIADILTSPRQTRQKEANGENRSPLLQTQIAECDYQPLCQVVSLLSGVALLEVGKNYKMFGISLIPNEQYRVTVVFAANRINDVVIHPEISVPPQILSYAKANNDLNFLLAEITDVIHQVVQFQ